MTRFIYIICFLTTITQSVRAEAWYSAPLKAQELIFGNELSWSTIYELNLQQFIIEKSNDGSVFEEIGILEASSFSMIDKQYHYMDVTPTYQITYYRLKEIGKNGSFSYSQMLSVEKKQRNDIRLLSFENLRVNEEFTAKFDALSDLTVACVLKSYKGEVLEQRIVQMKDGLNDVRFDLRQHKPGFYFVQIINADEKETIMIEKTEAKETKLPPVAILSNGIKRN